MGCYKKGDANLNFKMKIHEGTLGVDTTLDKEEGSDVLKDVVGGKIGRPNLNQVVSLENGRGVSELGSPSILFKKWGEYIKVTDMSFEIIKPVRARQR